MEDNQNDKISDEDLLLNKLIRASQKEPPDGFTRPDSDTVMAYLLGTANMKQKKTIRRTLLESPTFRREMRDLVQAMEKLDDESIQAAVDEEEDETIVPDRQELLEKYPHRPGEGAVKIPLWTRITELLTPKVYVPAVATIAIVALAFYISPVFRGPEMVQLVSLEKPERGYLTSILPRSAIAPATSDAFSDPYEAAMAGFRLLGDYDSGGFKIIPVLQRSEPTTEVQTISIQLTDSIRNKIQEFKAQVPDAGFDSDKPVKAWILTLPNLNLYRADIKSKSVEIMWTKEMGTEGCITLTYYNGDGYRAILGYTFDLH